MLLTQWIVFLLISYNVVSRVLLHTSYIKRSQRFVAFSNLFLLKVIRWDLDVKGRNYSLIAHHLFWFHTVRNLSPLDWSHTGHCSFQNEQCGLKSDRNATFHWTVGSGQTPTENTGPSYDHTSFDKDGKRSHKLKRNSSFSLVRYRANDKFL